MLSAEIEVRSACDCDMPIKHLVTKSRIYPMSEFNAGNYKIHYLYSSQLPAFFSFHSASV